MTLASSFPVNPEATPAIDPCPKTKVDKRPKERSSRPRRKKITAKDGRTPEERELAVRHELMKKYYDDKEPVLIEVAKAIKSTTAAVRRTTEWQNRDVLRTSMQLMDGPTARDSGMDVELVELIEEVVQRTSDSILSELKYVDHERLFAELAALGEGDLERLNSKINRTNSELRELTMAQVQKVIEDDPKLAAQTIVSLVSTVE